MISIQQSLHLNSRLIWNLIAQTIIHYLYFLECFMCVCFHQISPQGK